MTAMCSVCSAARCIPEHCIWKTSGISPAPPSSPRICTKRSGNASGKAADALRRTSHGLSLPAYGQTGLRGLRRDIVLLKPARRNTTTTAAKTDGARAADMHEKIKNALAAFLTPEHVDEIAAAAWEEYRKEQQPDESELLREELADAERAPERHKRHSERRKQ